MAQKVMLNCWIVMLWLWMEASGRSYAWVRRSRDFKGLIPHFGVSERVGFRGFRSIEYRPYKGSRLGKNDWLIAFSGHYVVVHYKIVAIRKWATKEQAVADHYFRG